MDGSLASRGAAAAVADCERFIRWFSSAGHWIHDTRADAARAWMERGISTLPDAPINAPEVLADWIAADPAPALIARLRADEAAAKRAATGALWLPLEVNHG